MGWTITPNDGGASVDASGRASFSQNTASSSKIYTITYTDGSITCSKDIKIEPNVPPTPCTYTVYSNIIGANVTWSNGATGTISSQGFSTTTATGEGTMTVTLDHTNGDTACTFVGNEAEVPCNGNIYISGSCDPISPPDPPEDYCKYVACDSHSIYADGTAHNPSSDRKCDSLYIYEGAVVQYYDPATDALIPRPTWIEAKLTHQFDGDWGTYYCTNFQTESGKQTAYRLQDKLGLAHNENDRNLASMFYLIEPNNTGGERSVVIRFSINGTTCKEATTITQGIGTCGGDMHNSTNATTTAIPATGGTNIQIGYFDHMGDCPHAWRVESYPEWVTNVQYVYDTPGVGSGQVRADIAENKTNVLRQGRGANSLGNIYEEIAIYQAGNNTICTCYASGIHDLTLPATTSNTEYEVGICSTSNCSSTSWQIPIYTSGYDFLEFTRVSGGKIYAKVKSKNSGSDIRSAVYTIKNGNACSDTFSVKQAGSTPTACTCDNASVSISGAAVSYKAGSGKTIGSFTASCNPKNLLSFTCTPNNALSNYKVIYYSDTKTGLIQADVTANPTTSQRIINVSASCNGGNYRIFGVTQNGKPAAACDCASANFSATGKTVSPGSNVTAATYTASCTDGAVVELESGVAILNGAIRLEGGNIVCDYVSASTVARTGTYKISIGGTRCVAFTVNCPATPATCKCSSVNLYKTDVTIGAYGGEVDVATIPANCKVVLFGTLPSWVSFFKNSSNQLIVEADENNTGADRGTGIPFAVEGDSSQPCGVVRVVQKHT